MSFSSFPIEIFLMIIEEIFNSREYFPSVDHQVDRPLHQAARAQRLAWFRGLAGVCKAWVDPHEQFSG
jgi:hypothetical protein